MPMRIPPGRIALLPLLLVTAACAPGSGPPAGPSASATPSRPDLIIRRVYLEMEGRQGNCVEAYTPYGIRVVVENVGPAGAGPFFVELNGARQEVNDGLMAGRSVVLHFAGTTPNGRYEATADAADQVAESQEDNNSLSFLAPTPTPPPLCTPTPTAAPAR